MKNRDFISLNEFMPHTRDGIRKFCEYYNTYDPTQLSLPEHWADLFFMMRSAPDNDEFFPSGKWTTIQRLEEFLTEYAVNKIAKGSTHE